jgi:glyoxylase-like metal-dependent hydrolase (beta-lactamase superfamily II)
VVRFTAPNPGPKTLEGTHTYVVGEDHAFIIDPGPSLPPYQDALAAWLSVDVGLATILLSHGHPDHAPGAARLSFSMDAAVWAPDAMSQEAADSLEVDHRFSDGQRFEVDGDRLEVVMTPGHTPDHAGFWLVNAGVFFSGDTILGTGTTLIAPPEGDMAVYMETLERIRALQPRIIAPGHGPLILDPAAKIDEYVAHRRGREEQILAALEAGPATLEELVERIYSDVDPRVLDLARGSVEAQLIKLAREGKVVKQNGRHRLRLDH